VIIASIWAIIFGFIFGEIFGPLGLWDYIFRRFSSTWASWELWLTRITSASTSVLGSTVL
jgi:hypothetical protein